MTCIWPRRPEGDGRPSLGRGRPLPTGGWVRGGGCARSPENFWNFYIKMVSFRAFWVAIGYRLAACFTGIGFGIEMLKQLLIICSMLSNFFWFVAAEDFVSCHALMMSRPS